MSGRMPLPEPLRRTGCSAHFQCASSSPVQRGLCYIGIGCTHPRGCRGVLSSTALGHVALHTRPPARRDPPLKAGHRSARAHFCADVVSDSDSRATRVCILEGRAEEMARLPESCGTAGSWITSCAPSRARRARTGVRRARPAVLRNASSKSARPSWRRAGEGRVISWKLHDLQTIWN